MSKDHPSRRPTQYDVARLAGVSQSAVSKVLNDPASASIPAETRQRILKAVEIVGYQPNVLARSLRVGKTHMLGLIVPDSANPFFAELGKHMEEAAYRQGYSVILCNTGGDPDRESFYTDTLLRQQVDGVIFVAGGNQANCLNQALERQIPVVVVDRDLPDCAVDTVLLDNFQGGLLATRHLLALGHRRIGCIAGPSNVTPSAERVLGYKAALGEYGIAVDDALIRQGNFQLESGWKRAHEILGQAPRPTALFACNDLMAVGALRAAAELGLSVPRDLSVVGFDNIELASYTAPPLTTVAQPTDEIGVKAVTLLIERIQDRTLKPRSERLDAALIIRESTGEVQSVRESRVAEQEYHIRGGDNG